MLLKGKDQRLMKEISSKLIMSADDQMDILSTGTVFSLYSAPPDICSSVNPCHAFFYFVELTLNFFILLQCSTVDQFSGESAPVILPLDDTQVTVFVIALGLK